MPVLGGEANDSCTILTLELVPLDLSVLGLNVFMDEVFLQITATPGRLVGDLLCEIADLLNGNGRALGRIRNLLNQVLGLLG